MKRLVFLVVFLLPSVCSFGIRPDTVKVLAIGNSFSADAVEEHLWPLAHAAGRPVIIGNMYIPGCSLERHCENMFGNKPAYSYRKISADGVMTKTPDFTLEMALADEEWDYVSFQQASPLSGLPDSYRPYLAELVEFVKERVSEDTVMMLHQTWAYDWDSSRAGFANYGRDQRVMYASIVSAVNEMAAETGITLVIPCGTAVQNARTSDELRSTMTRDGYHLHKPVGRYVAGCTWLESVLGVNPVRSQYCPEGMTVRQCRLAQKAAHKAVRRPDIVSSIK